MPRNPSVAHNSFRKPREQHLVLTLGLSAYPEEAVRLRRRDSEGLVEIVRRGVVLARQLRDDPGKTATYAILYIRALIVFSEPRDWCQLTPLLDSCGFQWFVFFFMPSPA